MNINITKLSRVALAIGAMTLGGAANAAVSWSLTGANCTAGDCSSVGTFGNSMTFKNSSGVGASAVLTAWSNTASSNTVLATAEANLFDPNGIGVQNQNTSKNSSGVVIETTSPHHAIDNDANVDSVLLNFGGTAVTLNSLKLGWSQTDSDVSVLAYTGAGAPTLAGKTYGGATGLIASGWTKVADLSNVGTASAASFNAASTYSSSYWLISAFNSSFGSTLDNTKDYFKLQLVGGNLPSGGGGGNGVPVPATALLMLGGLPILASMSRRRKSKAILAA